MSTVRAKFRVTQLDLETGNVALAPVESGSPENASFWEATPAGSLTMTITNEEALAHFAMGQEFYLDFTPAPPQKQPDFIK